MPYHSSYRQPDNNKGDGEGKPNWRERIQEGREAFNPEFEIKKQTQPSDTDTVINHPENDSNIKITDSGAIKMFADRNLGIIIDPNSQSITHICDKANYSTSEINLHTDRRGLKWNYTPLNRDLAHPTREVLTAISSPDGSISGTSIIKNILQNPGTYMTAAGPTSPGTISALDAVNLQGVTPFRGIKQIKQLQSIKEGLTEIINSTDLPDLGGLI